MQLKSVQPPQPLYTLGDGRMGEEKWEKREEPTENGMLGGDRSEEK